MRRKKKLERKKASVLIAGFGDSMPFKIAEVIARQEDMELYFSAFAENSGTVDHPSKLGEKISFVCKQLHETFLVRHKWEIDFIVDFGAGEDIIERVKLYNKCKIPFILSNTENNGLLEGLVKSSKNYAIVINQAQGSVFINDILCAIRFLIGGVPKVIKSFGSRKLQEVGYFFKMEDAPQ